MSNHCPECKAELSGEESVCSNCGYPLRLARTAPDLIAKRRDGRKRLWVLLLIVALALCIILPLVFASNSKKSNIESSYDSLTTRYYEYAPFVLKTSNVKLKSEYSYTTVDGTITNYGRYTYQFIKLKGAFKDRSGTVIDTDWTYAVGAEGLAPGESTTFHMSVPKNYSISNCDISVFDYS